MKNIKISFSKSPDIVILNFFRFKYFVRSEGLLQGSAELLRVLNNFIKIRVIGIQALLYRVYLKAKGNKPQDHILERPIMEDPFEVIYVPVELINYKLSGWIERAYVLKYGFDFKKIYDGKNRQIRAGIILGGDWDLHKTRFEYSTSYIALKQRFVEGKSWDETLYYKAFYERILRKGRARGGCSDLEEFKETFLEGRWDALYEDMAKNGYKSQAELGNNHKKEIEACVSRKGEIMFRDGRHRLAMAKITGVEKVPVIVNVWHEKYISRVREISGKERLTPSEAIEFALRDTTKVYP